MWLVVGLPLFGSVAVFFASRLSENFRNGLALALVLGAIAAALKLLPQVAEGSFTSVYAAGFAWFFADKLAVFMALVSLIVSAAIVLFSFGYIRHYQHRDEYYFMIILFLGAMMGLVFSRNLILLYLFWEITALACWRLIGFFREKHCVLRADKAFLVTAFGALVMLVGFLLIYHQVGSFDLHAIQERSRISPISDLAVLLILVGILSKSATLPLHTWLPDAGVAPSPVTAMLHAAVLVKIGVYVYARLFVATFAVDPVWHTIVPLIAGLSALVSAGAALIETDLKRIIAYSTVSQLGFIFLGLSLGNEMAIGGGILYILMHGIAKGGLFLCAGIVEQNTHQKDVTKLGGLIATMPVTAVCFIMCAFSVMGVPPFGGFFSKYMVMTGAVYSEQLGVALIFLVGAFMTMIYLLRVFALVFLGETRLSQGKDMPREGSLVMLVSVIVLAVLSIASGILIKYPHQFVYSMVHQLWG